MVPTAHQVVFALILPLIWAGVMWLAWMFMIRDRPRAAGIFAALAPIGAYAIAYWSGEERDTFPPHNGAHWLFYAGFAVGLIAVIEGVLRPKWWIFKPLFWVPASVALLLLIGPLFRHLKGVVPDDIPQSLKLSWELFLGAVAVALLLRAGLGRQGCGNPVAAVWTMGLTLAFAAPILGFSGSTMAPLRATPLGLSLLPLLALLITLRKPSKGGELPAATISVYVPLFVGTLFVSYVYDSMTVLSLCLLAVAPLMPLLLPNKLTGLRFTLARIGLTLVPLLIAFTVALVAFMKADDGGYPQSGY